MLLAEDELLDGVAAAADAEEVVSEVGWPNFEMSVLADCCA